MGQAARGARDPSLDGPNLTEMALRLQAALRRPIKPIEQVPSPQSNRPRPM
jgi:hypothetical protein